MQVQKQVKTLPMLLSQLQTQFLQSRNLRVRDLVFSVETTIEVSSQKIYMAILLLVLKLPKRTPSGLSIGTIFTICLSKNYLTGGLSSASHLISPLHM